MFLVRNDAQCEGGDKSGSNGGGVGAAARGKSPKAAVSGGAKSGRRPKPLTMAQNFAFAGAASILSKTLVAPIQFLKLRAHALAAISYTLEDDGYALPPDVHKELSASLDDDGPLGEAEGGWTGWLNMWKRALEGNLWNCVRYFPTQMMNFACKGTIKKPVKISRNTFILSWRLDPHSYAVVLCLRFRDRMFKVPRDSSYALRLASNVAAGTAAGALSLLLVYPLDRARMRDAMGIKSKRPWYDTPLRELYAGFGLSVLGIAAYRGVYFALYDTIRPIIKAQNFGFWGNFACGYAVTTVAGLIAYPIDTIRRLKMVDPDASPPLDLRLWAGARENILGGAAGTTVLIGFNNFRDVYIDWGSADNDNDDETQRRHRAQATADLLGVIANVATTISAITALARWLGSRK